MLKILNVPNKSLSAIAKPVVKIDGRIRKLISEMEKVLIAQEDPPGVGLAAPQVGQPLRLFIIKPTSSDKTQVFINPQVIGYKNKVKPIKTRSRRPKSSKLEGCLSIPRFWAPVSRQKTVKLHYLDHNGEEKTSSFSGFKATVIQHELDHLEGILFTQRALEQRAQIFEEDTEGKLKRVSY